MSSVSAEVLTKKEAAQAEWSSTSYYQMMARRVRKPVNVTTRKSAQVPGQLFGYSLQAIRLLDLALEASPGTVLGLEVFEDVGAVDAAGKTLASQTKSGLETNPVSDRAVDLWKTFSNWLTAVASGQLPVASTLFEIYVAKRHTGKFVALFSAAKTEDEAKAALGQVRDALWGTAPKYSKKKKLGGTLAPFVNHVLDPSSRDVFRIIQRFDLSVAVKDPLRDLRPKMDLKWIRPECREVVLKYAHGWIKEKLDGLLLEGKQHN